MAVTDFYYHHFQSLECYRNDLRVGLWLNAPARVAVEPCGISLFLSLQWCLQKVSYWAKGRCVCEERVRKRERERDWKHCCTRRLTQDLILKCCTRPTHRLGIMHASWFWVLSVYSDSLLVNICLSPCESNTRCENNGAFSSPEVNDSLGSNIVGLPQGAKTTKYACHPRHSAPSNSRHTHTGLYANCRYRSRDGASPTLETTTFIQTLLTLKPAGNPIHVGLSSRHHILWDARTTSSWICIYFSQA